MFTTLLAVAMLLLAATSEAQRAGPVGPPGPGPDPTGRPSPGFKGGPPAPRPDRERYCWTKWLDRDNPSGLGDYERVRDFRRQPGPPVCARPVHVLCRIRNGAYYPYGSGETVTPIIAFTSNLAGSIRTPYFSCMADNKLPCLLLPVAYKYTCDPLTGGLCLNRDQRCRDHEVRFHCKHGSIRSRYLDTRTCRTYCWTPWLNRDRPSGRGDYETIRNFHREQPRVVCPNPVGIQCRDTRTRRSYETTGQRYHCEIDFTPDGVFGGGWCVNGEQSGNRRCRDYQVRYLCPCS